MYIVYMRHNILFPIKSCCTAVYTSEDNPIANHKTL